jgi:hypothetical protein
VGDVIELPTREGQKRVSIKGIYADYGNEHGSVLLPQALFEKWFGSGLNWRAALMLKGGADAEQVRADLAAAHPGLAIRTQEHLRSEALRIFRQTFSVTYALEAVGVVVAVAGLGLALGSLLMDRALDRATLKSLGFSRSQIASVGVWEGFSLALVGVLVGTLAGVWLGWLLITVVNKQAFGWTLSYALPWLQVIGFGLVVLAVAVWVSRWVSRRGLALALVAVACSLSMELHAFEIAKPGRQFVFPADHGSHPDFRTEWWYLTGHLEAEVGRRLGFQVTFFRQAGEEETMYLAHCGLLDAETGRFLHQERLNRAGWDADAAVGSLSVRNGNWSMTMDGENIHVQGTIHGEAALSLKLKPLKPLVTFGVEGVSKKGVSVAAASHYLTFPRLECSGEVWRMKNCR